MDVHEALRAISTTGEGCCWYCDEKLPDADEAINSGWDVRRIAGERVATIILVCPSCRRLEIELGEEEFRRALSQRSATLIC